MSKSLFYLAIIVVIGGGIYAMVTYPAGCQRLANDVGRDGVELGRGIASVRENGQSHWDRATTPLKMLLHDMKSDLLTLSAPPAPPPVVEAPPVPEWKPPATFPAKEGWTWTTLSGRVYSNVKVVGMAEHSVTIIYDGGGGHVSLSELPDGLQTELGYDSDAVAETPPASTPAPAAAEPTAISTTATAAPPVNPIQSEYNATLAQARADRRKVLLLFTGSKWCPTCICLERDVLPTAKYRYFAEGYQVLKVELLKNPPADDPAQALANQYHVQGVPTLITLTPDGAEIARFMGCPTEFTTGNGTVDIFTDSMIATLTKTPPSNASNPLEQPPKL